MAKALPRKALIAISSYPGATYPNGKRTGLFFTEALHPFEVLTVAAQANDQGQPNVVTLGVPDERFVH